MVKPIIPGKANLLLVKPILDLKKYITNPCGLKMVGFPYTEHGGVSKTESITSFDIIGFDVN